MQSFRDQNFCWTNEREKPRVALEILPDPLLSSHSACLESEFAAHRAFKSLISNRFQFWRRLPAVHRLVIWPPEAALFCLYWALGLTSCHMTCAARGNCRCDFPTVRHGAISSGSTGCSRRLAVWPPPPSPPCVRSMANGTALHWWQPIRWRLPKWPRALLHAPVCRTLSVLSSSLGYCAAVPVVTAACVLCSALIRRHAPRPGCSLLLLLLLVLQLRDRHVPRCQTKIDASCAMVSGNSRHTAPTGEDWRESGHSRAPW